MTTDQVPDSVRGLLVSHSRNGRLPTTATMGRSPQDLGVAVKQPRWLHRSAAHRRLRSETGLSLTQLDVLGYPHIEPDAPLHALAVRAHQSEQSVGELARRMVERKPLVRVESPSRAVHHQLTEKERTGCRAGSSITDLVLSETVNALTDEEQSSLHASTKAVAGLVSDEPAPHRDG